MSSLKHVLILLALLVVTGGASARGTYLSIEQFLHGAFDGEQPLASKLWLNGSERDSLAKVLGHPVGLRVNYWHQGERSAWVLEEIGKELPITIGIVVQANRLVDVRILAFRESRGGEVRYPFFTRQFVGARLKSAAGGLDTSIDGISGATMSVDAVTRAAEAALVMDRLLTERLAQGD